MRKMIVEAFLVTVLLSSVFPPMLANAAGGSTNGILNQGFEFPDGTPWHPYAVYGGGSVMANDTSNPHTGNRAAKLDVPIGTTSTCGGQGTDKVRAALVQAITAPNFSVANLVDVNGSFSVWWLIQSTTSPYSVRAEVDLSGGYSLEYYYGTLLTHSSLSVSFDLGPVPVGQGWVQTKRNIHLDAQQLNLAQPSTVRVVAVWFGAFGDCTTQGETAWVDDVALLFTAPAITPPVASFTAKTISGPLPITINFDASQSYTTSPGTSIVNYSWIADDGSQGSGVTWTRTFDSLANHYVTLSVRDSNGLVGNQTQLIAVPPRNSTQPDPLLSIVSGGLFIALIVLALFFLKRFPKIRRRSA